MEREKLPVKYQLLADIVNFASLRYKYSDPETAEFSREKAACHSGIFHKKLLTCTFHHNASEYSKEDRQTWVSFLNECGFPCEVEDEYIKLLGANYLSISHVRSAFTAIRYINYNYCKTYCKVPNIALTIYNETPFTAFQSFMIAHYIAIQKYSYWDSGHGLVYSTYYITPEDKIVDAYKKYAAVNACFNIDQKTKLDTVATEQLVKLFEKKKYNELEELVIKNKLI